MVQPLPDRDMYIMTTAYLFTIAINYCDTIISIISDPIPLAIIMFPPSGEIIERMTLKFLPWRYCHKQFIRKCLSTNKG